MVRPGNLFAFFLQRRSGDTGDEIGSVDRVDLADEESSIEPVVSLFTVSTLLRQNCITPYSTCAAGERKAKMKLFQED